MRQEILVGGQTRSFIVLTAGSGTEPTAPHSLEAVVIVLHGSSQTGLSMRAFSGNSFDKLAETGRVAVVYPDGLKKLWNHKKSAHMATDDVAFLAALADHFHRLHGPIPVIVVGFSNGGQLVIRLIHEIPGKLHGAAIIGATLPRPGGLVFSDKHQPLPVMLVHGTHDVVVPYGGEGWFANLFGKVRGPSALQTAQYFARRNLISAPPVTVALPHRRESGRTSVTLSRFEQDGHPPVALYTVAGGGHVVPHRRRKTISIAGRTTQDISAVEALTEFFPVLQPWPPAR
ncbi:polyhydroxybutyrate depolymerase [Arthrobacter alpinus]|uniref:Polyhydroxybutyrate depolymerase n=1 Tax=Arthrobacter alpinus TaxID=656366 RepID=A0A1H5NNS1_9MICC|nr:hypothetical protein [Arthrobacter alpinus]SEF03319.1 polyhydroxybutyrate depolymerase [Arthrobacter alpinus]